MANDIVMDEDGTCECDPEESREDRLARENLIMAANIAKLEGALARRDARIARDEVLYRRHHVPARAVVGPVRTLPLVTLAWLSVGLRSGAIDEPTYVALTTGESWYSHQDHHRGIWLDLLDAEQALAMLGKACNE
jgi:hypothetical protein